MTPATGRESPLPPAALLSTMRTGSRLRELWGHRRGLAASAVLALALAFLSVFELSLSPPGITPRRLEIGAASTQLLVDTPSSRIVDLKSSSSDLEALTARADLLGNLMVSLPVKSRIARKIGVRVGQIQASAPITANVPRDLVEPGSGGSATDIVAGADHYKLQIQADPTVPILRIYTQAPTRAEAAALAGASVAGLREYLTKLADNQGIPADERVTLRRFGVVHGGVVNRGVGVQIALLTFFVAFALSACAVLFLARVRHGWRLAGPARGAHA